MGETGVFSKPNSPPLSPRFCYPSPNQAITDYQNAVRVDPRDAGARTCLGQSYWESGNADQAMLHYNEALRVNPEYTLAYCRRALVFAKLGQTASALNDLDKAARVRFFPGNHLYEEVWHRQEVAWFLATCPDSRLRKADWAVRLANEAREFRPDAGYVWAALGAAQYRAGNWRAALHTLEGCSERRSYRDVAAWLFLSMAHWQLGEHQAAHHWYKKAVEWMDTNGPTDQEVVRLRAEAEGLLGIAETNSEEGKEWQ